MAIIRPYAMTDLFAMARAGLAWCIDDAGALAQVAANQLRVDYDPQLAVRGVLVEEAGANVITNPRWQGAAPGTPGTNPSGWSGFDGSGGGITREILGLPMVQGRQCLAVRWTGAASGTVDRSFRSMGGLSVAAAVGQLWAVGTDVAVLAGSLSGVTLRHTLLELNSGGGQIAATDTFFVPDATLRRFATTRTFNQALAAYVIGSVTARFANGVPVDVTLLYALPQVGPGVPSSPILPSPATVAASTRAADDFTAINLPRWLNPAAGTFVVDVMPGQATAPTHRGILCIDDGTADTRFRLRMLPSATTMRLSVDVAGVEALGIEQASGPALTRHTARISYGPAGWLLSVNGAAPVQAAGPVPAGLVRALLGRGATAAEYLNGWLGPRFEYYPAQYTDTPAADGYTIRTR